LYYRAMSRLRIHYLFVWPDFSDAGVPRKVAEQTRVWTEFGCEVSVHLLSKDASASRWQAVVHPSVSTRLYPYASAASRLRSAAAAVAAAIEAGADVLYTRFDVFMPAFISARRAVPIVFEVNSDDVAEDRAAPLARRVYNRLTRGVTLRCAAGFVFVSRELAASRSFRRNGVPAEVVSNGIDLATVQPLDPPEGRRTTLVFIGSRGRDWHGVDKIVKLARERPQWAFDVIGLYPSDVPHAPENVTLHGPLHGGDAVAVMARAHVAIGTLAMHRKGMDEGSPLKTRQYLALGLPVIIAYEDTDFPDGAPFLLRLPNVEDNVLPHLHRIDKFVSGWSGRRVDRSAVRCIDSLEKERRRVAFFQRVARGSP